MNKVLVGYTGFVGSNLVSQISFDRLYNSQNITAAFDTNPDMLIYAGVRAEKYIANKYPEQDYMTIRIAIENIKKITPKKLVLISTIDVYDSPAEVDEESNINAGNLQPYGYNRLLLERWVEKNIKDYFIVRLPALYGKNLRKNFIYDIINIIPQKLSNDRYHELVKKEDFITYYYTQQENGFYNCKNLSLDERINLKAYFNRIGFNALSFTDSRSQFQFYNLSFLWDHIRLTLDNNIRKMNLATEPIAAGSLFKYIRGYVL
jgi:dTDP-4-dehydrorhamnose reductase